MTTTTLTRKRKLFVNLPVRDLPRTIGFFTRLGFTFNQQFTDETATCMLIGEDAYCMLLTEAKFKSFTDKQLCDPRTHVQGLFALSCESRAEVDEMVRRAIDAGGSAAGKAQDHGFMYEWGFYDLDGHGWGVLWMDPATIEPQS